MFIDLRDVLMFDCELLWDRLAVLGIPLYPGKKELCAFPFYNTAGNLSFGPSC